MAQKTGWLGGLKEVLVRSEVTHQPRPENDNLVEIPQGLDKLRRAIMHIQNEIVEAQAEAADITSAERQVLNEIAAAREKNALRQRDAMHRQYRLQEEWAKITRDLGIRAEVLLPVGSVTEAE